MDAALYEESYKNYFIFAEICICNQNNGFTMLNMQNRWLL